MVSTLSTHWGLSFSVHPPPLPPPPPPPLGHFQAGGLSHSDVQPHLRSPSVAHREQEPWCAPTIGRRRIKGAAWKFNQHRSHWASLQSADPALTAVAHLEEIHAYAWNKCVSGAGMRKPAGRKYYLSSIFGKFGRNWLHVAIIILPVFVLITGLIDN